MPTLSDKTDLRKVVLTIDMGGSKNKAMVQEYPEGKTSVLLLDPEVADIPSASIDTIESHGELESRVWIQTAEGSYALGELARRRFGGILQLKELKYELAVPKVCGLVWLAKEKLNLPNNFAIYLTILLPSGEVQDKKQLKLSLEKVLRSFLTPSGKIRLKLLYCDFAAEGSGVYFYHRLYGGDRSLPPSIYAMLGYRNASIFSVRSGILSPGVTSTFGMAWLVNNFVAKVSGLSADNPAIVEVIVEAGSNCDSLVLQKLSRKRRMADVEADGELFSKALTLARQEYVLAIARWLRSNIDEDIEELIFCGGTVDYIHAEIDNFFQKQSKISIFWHGNISIPEEMFASIGNRLADVYALHQHIVVLLDAKMGYDRLVSVSTKANEVSDVKEFSTNTSQKFDYTPRPRPKNFVNVNENL
ncbi:ParM/StbA family protein [Chlorogloea sp. CCALA 695]|uniref:ParM/StbA family protein n=1 Tax=Chlorogloea sp. CCALA 695 TaxID=2107693 RepID=UPI000D070E66|nr:ParM/StbA family protein [Chlorogloea sp. CCALA 695]PSB30825.1 hypothetical protein C7B70_15330 [Chlorogloea sp. CCALA 695]